MHKNSGIKFAIILMSALLVFTVSCQKKTVAVDKGLNSSTQDSGYQTSSTDHSDASEGSLQSVSGTSGGSAGVVLQESIFFEFDKATLTSVSQEILTKNGEWLRTNSDVMITVEGHCDERGTNGYNLALGDRRAETVKTFLVDLGVHRSRMTTISYGEERPLDQGYGEAAWAKNRRAHFLIK